MLNCFRIVFIFTLLLLIGCNQQQENHENKDYLKIVSDFSENYNPENIKNFDSVNSEIINAFTQLRKTNKKAHKTYVTLVFVKLYAEHLTCCHQGYIIASIHKNDFDQDNISMVNEFAYISNYIDYKNPPEVLSSGIIEKWIKENPELLENISIKKEVDQISKINKMILNGEFWKE